MLVATKLVCQRAEPAGQSKRLVGCSRPRGCEGDILSLVVCEDCRVRISGESFRYTTAAQRASAKVRGGGSARIRPAWPAVRGAHVDGCTESSGLPLCVEASPAKKHLGNPRAARGSRTPQYARARGVDSAAALGAGVFSDCGGVGEAGEHLEYRFTSRRLEAGGNFRGGGRICHIREARRGQKF